MPKFVAGVVRFQSEVFPQKKDLFEQLSQGQAPEALFITCLDSRIETAMITQTDPGDLFVCRNAGNIAPPHKNQTGGMTASIEFAVAALQVPHIVICGHTNCGAMKGAMNPESLDKLPHVRDWLSYSKAAVDIVHELGDSANDQDRMTMLLEQNVVLQLQHLRTHPAVSERLAKRDVTLHGWVYDIATGNVTAYDEATNRFEPFSAAYASEVANFDGTASGDDH